MRISDCGLEEEALRDDESAAVISVTQSSPLFKSAFRNPHSAIVGGE
jgi:hypothetical protein